MHRRAILGAFVGASAALSLATGCGEKPGAGSKNDSGLSAPRAAPVAPGIAPLVNGDRASLRHYLETVDTVRGATFDVTWSPRTVRLDRTETARALARVSRDGATFTFDAGEAKIQSLTPGRILLVWGVALRKVVQLEPRGGSVVVHTEPASLPEAIERGTIAWRARTNFAQGVVTPREVIADSAARHAARRGGEMLFRYAGFVQGEQAPGAAEGAGPEEEELPGHAAGEVAGYEFEIGFGHEGDRLNFQLEARKGDSPAFEDTQEGVGERTRAHGTGSAAGPRPEPEYGAKPPLTDEEKKQAKELAEEEKNTKQGVGEIEHPGSVLTPKGLFGLASEMFDLRVKARGHLDGFESQGTIAIAKEALDNFSYSIGGIQGEVDFAWIARLGEKGDFSERIKVEVPFNYDIPLIIGGLPFMVEIGMNFIAAPGLTTHFASATGTYHVTLGGDAGLTATATGASAKGSLAAEAKTSERQVTSVGVSAVLVAIQAPRIGFGLGLLNTSAIAFVDNVLTTSVLTSGAVGVIPCRRYQINDHVGAGVEAKILGITVPGVGKRQNIATPFEKVETEPAGLNCKVGGE